MPEPSPLHESLRFTIDAVNRMQAEPDPEQWVTAVVTHLRLLSHRERRTLLAGLPDLANLLEQLRVAVALVEDTAPPLLALVKTPEGRAIEATVDPDTMTPGASPRLPAWMAQAPSLRHQNLDPLQPGDTTPDCGNVDKSVDKSAP